MTTLAATVTNTSRILGITISESHNTPSSTAVITALTTSLDMGDNVIVYIGYEGDLVKVFEGWVKQVEQTVPENVYTITCNDELIKATDYFIASSTPETAYSRQGVSAEDLVGDLLGLADITSYTSDTTYFTFGITQPVEVNLISSYDMCKTIADILAWHLWADQSGVVHFEDRKPFVMDTDTPVKTINSGILRISHRLSDRDLRNRIVIYGYPGINAVAEAESPYLPAGFRKTVVVASQWIDDQGMADDAAAWNLEKLNRLTDETSLEIIGDPDLHSRQVITVTESYTGITGDWYIYSCEHSWSDAGYLQIWN